jgi:mannose-1-phosphate guanylyltransferase
MRAMILAAGYGTRMRPVTYTLPKPLVPVCNRPLIDWAVETFLRAGIRDLIVNLHHLPEPLEQHLLATHDADFHFSYEAEILGTGGGIKRVQPLLEAEEDFIVVNGDTIQFPDYDSLCRARRGRDALSSLLLRHPPAGDRFTPVWSDDGEITGFGTSGAPHPGASRLSLPEGPLPASGERVAEGRGRGALGESLMYSGAQCVSARVFRYLPEGSSGIVEHVYQPLLHAGTERLASVTDDNPLWFDTGTPRRLIEASATLLDATLLGVCAVVKGSRIDGDSIVAATARGSAVRSTIGERSVIEGDVRDSAVWDDCRVAAGVELDRCIVAHGVELQRRGRYRDVLISGEDQFVPI